MAGLLRFLAQLIVWIAKLTQKLFPNSSTPPQPSYFLTSVLKLIYPGHELKQLECLTDIYFRYGLFQHGGYIYLLDPRMSQSAINKLDKGAVEYLQNSPLSDSFLGSSDRSPETRRAIAAIFRKSNMEANAGKMIQVIERTVEKISRQSTLNVNQISLQMALDIVGHVLFGLELDALGCKQDKLIDAMMTILHRAYALKEISPESSEFKQAEKDLDTMTSQILQSALEVSDDVEKSLARILNDITGFKECKSNMELFLMAGSETTASSIPVFLYLVVNTPGLQKELQEEADEYFSKLRADASIVPPKLESALREMLRAYAIAPYISRRTHEEMKLRDFLIPHDSSLRIFTWGIHRCPELWPQSKTFLPGRFCPGYKSKANTASERGQFWIPFGAGARVCIGQHLAWVELKLALTYFLHYFTFSKVKVTEPLEFCVDWEHAVVHVDKDVVLGVARRR
ncbi:cytochrome P450 3A41-like [Littorina saxatilis]|uniref:Cytochrome P450 n=1 Tax=Littorina saxatilis TaxID=31220 RepID=A0AAN9BFZ0_9CAEN